MKRVSMLISTIAAASLLAGAVGCSSNAFEQVAVTKDTSVLAGCQQLQSVTADPKELNADAYDDLSRQARQQGGNYGLVANDDARAGTAYRCTTPAQPPAAR